MSPPSTHCIGELSAKDLERFTQTLSLPVRTLPSPAWLKDQQACIPDLPYRLRKPHSLLPRLAMALPFTDKACLCKSHRGLDPHLIRRIFLQVSAECTTRLSRLVESPQPRPIALFVRRLQTINSLWMDPDLYRVTFACMPDEERFERVPSECEACILASVGGSPSMLFDLRASMLGRRKKGKHEPRLLRLVDAWMEWTAQGDVLRTASDSFAKDVRACRRRMQKARRQQKRGGQAGTGIETEDPREQLLQNDFYAEEHREREESNEDDPEGSIIDYYASRVRRNTGGRTDARAMHPAFRESMSFPLSPVSARESLPPRPGNPTAYTGTEPSMARHRGAAAARPGPPLAWANNNNNHHRKPPRHTAAYSESVYSRAPDGSAVGSDLHLPPMPPLARRMNSSEEQADAYLEMLVHDLDEEGAYVSPRVDWGRALREREVMDDAQAEADDRRQTTMTDFIRPRA
ncbi:hypothetical protein MBM_02161 [Drepanopeziza brunnea f. sp. 'multigermtubi' MB_m1]|uniref:Uncharacterized protein n=1 Tax=Marssonina brunnea f. sp. multigermtubi (strain MB_m1) TaxID=1072389 RepID=K1Y502_MARBU|nr:uncharacterized protein MBM_02161 [Drepanopeziza brunnea f. sp. 'multigermtubi' MB_m1]EKD20209.1 hypothetical protein MBM_02161 [Drepanopeziza brunnea f. sp. 'multigermtubi' MB_m1]